MPGEELLDLVQQYVETIRTCTGEDYRTQPIPGPLDDLISRLAAAHLAADAHHRELTFGALTLRERIFLFLYAERMGTDAVRRGRSDSVLHGLTALAIAAEDPQIDDRDVLVRLSLLHHVAGLIGDSARRLFFQATAGSSRRVADLFLGFLDRDPVHQHIEAMGWTEKNTPDGVFFSLLL
jgi:hypothetical protein